MIHCLLLYLSLHSDTQYTIKGLRCIGAVLEAMRAKKVNWNVCNYCYRIQTLNWMQCLVVCLLTLLCFHLIILCFKHTFVNSSKSKRTALHNASKNNYISLCKALIAAGITVNALDCEKRNGCFVLCLLWIYVVSNTQKTYY